MIANKSLGGFHLHFEKDDAHEMVCALYSLLETGASKPIRLENISPVAYKNLLLLQSSNEDDVLIQDSLVIKLYLSLDSIDFALSKLSLFLTDGHFSSLSFVNVCLTVQSSLCILWEGRFSRGLQGGDLDVK